MKAPAPDFAQMVVNATTWKYPLDVHAAICCELRVNPKTWIVPVEVRELWAAHMPTYEDFRATEAFADEANNVVFFYSPQWTEKYGLWLMHHELWHQSQYYDHGNAKSMRWDGMSTAQRHNAWEREACNYANERIGKVDSDFQSYCGKGDTSGAPKVKSPRTRRKRANAPVRTSLI